VNNWRVDSRASKLPRKPLLRYRQKLVSDSVTSMRENIRDIKSGKTVKDTAPARGLTPRRLAAIVIGDIAGYSRLMESDEEDTHARVRRIQRDLIEPSIAEHYGRLVKTTGDGFVAIFDSPLESVRCAIVIQQNMISRNAGLTKDQCIEYRIGVNLGDVIIEDDDIYGDGVNVASRIESLAEPGQVYISGGIYEQIKNKLVCGYQSLGDRKVKNITDPVRVYRVLPDPTAFKTRKGRKNVVFAAIGVLLLGVASGAAWYWLPHLKMDTTGPALQSAQGDSALAVAATDKQAALQGAPPNQPSGSVREPEMIMLQGGTFAMGSNDDSTEKPIHQVTLKPFAMSRYPISIREWNACAATKACPFVATGEDDAPITNVSWDDARHYTAWLARATGKPYRLPTEAEWEYAARGGTQTKYWWGDELQSGLANCRNCATVASAEQQPVKVGSFKANPFGLYDMGGSVDQWVQDCWHKNYQGAPSDGSAWAESDDCSHHVIRSGSWKNDASYVRPANRDSYGNARYPTHGFRLALTP
jgi:formylglycine-generating enzyme required for sulfatase activity/class 3 adenylate cyclase